MTGLLPVYSYSVGNELQKMPRCQLLLTFLVNMKTYLPQNINDSFNHLQKNESIWGNLGA